MYYYIYTHIYICAYLYILERGRERNMCVREKHQLVAFCTCPNQGMNPQHWYVT